MIYTSYFSRLKYIPEGFVPVSIALKSPVFYTGLRYEKLAPTYNILGIYKQDKNKDLYTEVYSREVLSKLQVREVLSDLLNLTGSYDICLMCYEKADDFCHRHLVREWLCSHGVRCEEMII